MSSITTSETYPTTAIIEPETFINEYGQEFIKYVWYDAEIAIIKTEEINNGKT